MILPLRRARPQALGVEEMPTPLQLCEDKWHFLSEWVHLLHTDATLWHFLLHCAAWLHHQASISIVLLHIHILLLLFLQQVSSTSASGLNRCGISTRNSYAKCRVSVVVNSFRGFSTSCVKWFLFPIINVDTDIPRFSFVTLYNELIDWYRRRRGSLPLWTLLFFGFPSAVMPFFCWRVTTLHQTESQNPISIDKILVGIGINLPSNLGILGGLVVSPWEKKKTTLTNGFDLSPRTIGCRNADILHDESSASLVKKQAQTRGGAHCFAKMLCGPHDGYGPSWVVFLARGGG